MINDLEKSLKRWLKKKVKITLSFMVAFLLGTNYSYSELIFNGTANDSVILEGKKNEFKYQIGDGTPVSDNETIFKNNGVINGNKERYIDLYKGNLGDQGVHLSRYINYGLKARVDGYSSDLIPNWGYLLENNGVINLPDSTDRDNNRDNVGLYLESSSYLKNGEVKNNGLITDLTSKRKENFRKYIGVLLGSELRNSAYYETGKQNLKIENNGIIGLTNASGIGVHVLGNIALNSYEAKVNIINNGMIKLENLEKEGLKQGIYLEKGAEVENITNNGLMYINGITTPGNTYVDSYHIFNRYSEIPYLKNSGLMLTMVENSGSTVNEHGLQFAGGIQINNDSSPNQSRAENLINDGMIDVKGKFIEYEGRPDKLELIGIDSEGASYNINNNAVIDVIGTNNEKVYTAGIDGNVYKIINNGVINSNSSSNNSYGINNNIYYSGSFNKNDGENIINNGVIYGKTVAVKSDIKKVSTPIGTGKNYGLLISGGENITDGIELVDVGNTDKNTIINYGLGFTTEDGVNFKTHSSNNFGSILTGISVDMASNMASYRTDIKVTEKWEGSTIVNAKAINLTNDETFNGTESIVLDNGDLKLSQVNSNFNDVNLTDKSNHYIFNGVNDTLKVIGKNNTLSDSIVNAYGTAIKIDDNSKFTGNGVTINGGVKEGISVIEGTDGENILVLQKEYYLNGDTNMGAGDDHITLGTEGYLNGNLYGGEGKDTLVFGNISKENNPNENIEKDNLNIFKNIDGFETISINNGDVTLYETAKITGAEDLIIGAGSQVNLRLDSTVKESDGSYKTHALYNDKDKTLNIVGDTSKFDEDTIVSEKDTDEFDKLSILNIVTSGADVEGLTEEGVVINFGNVNIDMEKNETASSQGGKYVNGGSVWVKTDSILTHAEIDSIQNNGKYDTKVKIKGYEDLFSIMDKTDPEIPPIDPEPEDGGEPGTPLEPATKYVGNEYNLNAVENIEGNNGIEKIFSGVNGKVEKYNNAGTIIGKYEETGDNSETGNGMIYLTTENNLSVKRLENTGNILGSILVGNTTDTEVINKNSGNGISLLLDSNSIFEDKLDHNLVLEEGIVNSGVIEGKAINNTVNGKNINSGNGINISSELKEGEVSNIKIAVSDNAVGIENSGFILGELSGKDKTTSEYSGNGIAMTFKGAEGNIEIGNIENTGVIKAIHNASVTELNSTNSNNGIIISDSSSGTLTLGKIENNGLVNIERNISPTNTKENGSSHIAQESYNGIVIENKNLNSNLTFETIENNGSILVSGKSSVDVQDEFSLNGIYVGTTGAINGTIKNDGKVASGWGSSDANSKNYGNGILIYSTEQNEGSTINLENTGLIVGKENAIAISQNSNIEFNYNNYGVIAGKNLVSASGYDDNKSVGQGLGIKLNVDGTISSVVVGNLSKKDYNLKIFKDDSDTSKYSIINTEIKDKDAYNVYNKDTNLSNIIINGAGDTSGTVTITNGKEFSLNNGVVNAYKTAITIGDNSTFTGTNVIINGGGLVGSGNETDVIKGNNDVKLNLAGEIYINGSIDLDSNGNLDDKDILAFGNGEIRTEAGIFDTIKGADTISIGNNTDINLYETSKLEGTNEINIAKGGELSLRVDANKTEEINGQTYIVGHALYNNGSNIVIKGDGATNGVEEPDKDAPINDIINGDANLSDVTNGKEEYGQDNYKESSVFDIVTNGLGRNSLIALGDVTIDDTNKLWIKTNSILTKAELQEQSPIKTLEYVDEEIKDPGTVIKVEAEKDIFEMDNNPDNPVDKKENLYIKLNEIYKGIYSSGDRNFNALNDIVTNFTFGDKDKGDYPIIGNEQNQMATLLGYLRGVYEETPYSFSNEATRKSMGLFHDTIRDNEFKAKDKEWLIYGGLVHQSGDQEQTYYGRNYHGFDTGSAYTDVNIKLTGAYGQFEYGNSDTLSTGLLVGGTKADVDVASSKLDGTSAYIGAYAKKDIKDFRLIAGIGYQYSEYDGTRNTINQSYSQDYSDRGVNLYLDGRYSYDLGNNFYLEPKAGLSYSYIIQDSIKENQEQTLALDVDSKDFNILEGTIGVDVKKVIPTEKGKHSISAGVTYRSILSGEDADYLTANYGGSDFEILIPHKNKNQVSVGAKYEVELENGMFYNVKGNYFMNVDSKENTNKNADTGEWRVGVGFGYRFNSIKDLNPVAMLSSFSLRTDNYFEFDKSELKPEGKAVVKKISTELNKDDVVGVLNIEGHTDSKGAKEYNQKLSEERAKSTENEFKKNITNDKIQYETKGYGEERPIVDNNTEEGRAKNRRVEIRFEGTQEKR